MTSQSRVGPECLASLCLQLLGSHLPVTRGSCRKAFETKLEPVLHPSKPDLRWYSLVAPLQGVHLPFRLKRESEKAPEALVMETLRLKLGL